MDTINWLHLRGLAMLAFLGLFFMYAVLVASWHNWRVKRRARRIALRHKLLSAESFAGGGPSPTAEPRAWRDLNSSVETPRRAA
jgi:hypothetical protein